MKENFLPSFELVVGHEGGLSMDRADRGNWTSGQIGVGKLNGTKYGVSAMAYPHLDIRNLTLRDAQDIYRRDYWNKARCDELPAGLDYLVFDAAVNHGVSRAVRFLQAAVGATVDGVIGANTIARATRALDQSKAVTSFCITRALFYTDIGTFQRYKNGWFRRVFETHATALIIVGETETDKSANTLSIIDEKPKAAIDVPATEDEKAFWLDISRRAQEAAERAEALAAR